MPTARMARTRSRTGKGRLDRRGLVPPLSMRRWRTLPCVSFGTSSRRIPERTRHPLLGGGKVRSSTPTKPTESLFWPANSSTSKPNQRGCGPRKKTIVTLILAARNGRTSSSGNGSQEVCPARMMGGLSAQSARPPWQEYAPSSPHSRCWYMRPISRAPPTRGICIARPGHGLDGRRGFECELCFETNPKVSPVTVWKASSPQAGASGRRGLPHSVGGRLSTRGGVKKGLL